MTEATTVKELPPITDLLLNSSPYDAFTITEGNADEVASIENSAEAVDAYCVDCKQVSVFRKPPDEYLRRLPLPGPNINGGNRSGVQTPPPPPPAKTDAYVAERTFSVKLVCSRNDTHKIYFYFRIINKTITKIGQYPSVADFNIKGLEKYRSILEKDRYRELSRAIGLFAHGVGVGSFVYLRRIFEHLIEQEHNLAVSDANWNEDMYHSSRVEGKIAMLSHKLPSFLVENKALYSILSKGIHSLTEDECLKYFGIVRTGIELILDERIEQQERRRKIDQVSRTISDLKKNLS